VKGEYEVKVPIVGHAWVSVIADSEEEAIAKAIGKVEMADIEEWMGLEHITQGNFFYGTCNEVHAKRIGDADDAE